jgi:hypothetical protein
MTEFRCGRIRGRSTLGGSGPGLKLVRNASRGVRQIRPIVLTKSPGVSFLLGIAFGHLHDYCAGDEVFYLQPLRTTRPEP